jgi:hypothetical protein
MLDARTIHTVAFLSLLLAAPASGCGELGDDGSTEPGEGAEFRDDRADTFEDARPSCVQTELDGVETPLFADAEDSDTFYYLPERFVVTRLEAVHWGAVSTFQHFEASDYAMRQKYWADFTIELAAREDLSELEERLRAENPEASLAPLPVESNGDPEIVLAVTDQENIEQQEVDFDVDELRLTGHVDTNREGLENFLTFSSKRVGFNMLVVPLTFRCVEAEGALRTREINPQASGASVDWAIDSIPVDFSHGAVAGSSDQVMLGWDLGDLYTNGEVAYFAEHTDELEALLTRLHDYDVRTWEPEDVRAIGEEVQKLVDGARQAAVEAGFDGEELDDDLRSLRHHAEKLANFEPDVDDYQLEEPK